MTATKKLIKILNCFKDKKIAVVGDLMLDHFIWGDTERISPEAPIPVVLITKESLKPGGAGNVVANIASLGGRAYLFGMVGKDLAGKRLLGQLQKRLIETSGIVQDEYKSTIKKTRVIARGQQLVRIDREEYLYIKNSVEKELFKLVSNRLKSCHVVVISDYAKGTITKNLAKKIIKIAIKYHKPIIVDTKPKHANFFKNITLLTPNHSEAVIIGQSEDIVRSGKKIQKKLNCQVLITEGAAGMTLFEKNSYFRLPTKAKEVFDVAGAGDTVVAVLALSLASGADLKQAAILANHGAGIVVGKVGIATVSLAELREDLLNNG